jgi:hypothetical protein
MRFKGEREGWFKTDFAAEGWRPVTVPGSFAKVAPDIDWQIGRLKAGFEGTQASYVCGIAIWCWADHPWGKTWLQPPLSPCVVFSRNRTPRPSVEIAKQGFLERQMQFKARTEEHDGALRLVLRLSLHTISLYRKLRCMPLRRVLDRVHLCSFASFLVACPHGFLRHRYRDYQYESRRA